MTTRQREWLQVRAYVREHRHDLSVVAAQRYPGVVKVAGTSLRGRPEWLPPGPVPLESIVLERATSLVEPLVTGADSFTEHLRPERVVGLGVDPLTFATDLLAVVSVDAPPYDELFAAVVDTNDEGRLACEVPGRERIQATRPSSAGPVIEVRIRMKFAVEVSSGAAERKTRGVRNTTRRTPLRPRS